MTSPPHTYIHTNVHTYIHTHVHTYTDGVFSFMDTYEDKSLNLMVSEHETSEEKKELAKKFEEVCPNCGN